MIFLASVSFRWLPVCPRRESGSVTRSSNAGAPGNMRILDRLMIFLASVRFRVLPVCPCKGSGAVTRISNTVFPGNIRELVALMVFLAFVSFRGLPWDSVSFHKHPVCPCKAVGRGNPKF